MGIIFSLKIQNSSIPATILKDWAEKTFLTATDLWTFRKQVLFLCFVEEIVGGGGGEVGIVSCGEWTGGGAWFVR